MLSQLKISYSGVRGVVGKSLTPEVAAKFGAAYAFFLQKRFSAPTILMGRDTRASGEALQNHLIRGLSILPGKIIKLGVLPTPTLQQALGEFNADGGIVITASHNPHQWNGFKFFLGPDNTVLNGEETQELFDLFQTIELIPNPVPQMQILTEPEKASETHLRKVLSQIEVEAIKQRRFKVILDSAQGTGEQLGVRLLENLGCEVELLRHERESEPTPENLKWLSKAVKNLKADLGFAQDLDADRLALVSESGLPLGEDYTLVLVTRHLLTKLAALHPIIVKNSSTTAAVDELASQYHAEVIEAKVGEINLSRALIKCIKERKIAFGGEGNGGIIYPPISYGRDSFIAMALILEYLALRQLPLSVLAAELPKYHQVKTKIARDESLALTSYFKHMQQKFPEAQADFTDGLKLVFPNQGWLQIRPSNTEPILRIIAEGKEPLWAGQIMAQVLL